MGFDPAPPLIDWARATPAGVPARARASRATQKRGLIVTWGSVKSLGRPALTRATGPLAILDDHHFSPGWVFGSTIAFKVVRSRARIGIVPLRIYLPQC
ncbi:hypothetical protein D3C75_1217250 [compost metagenome]